MDAFNLDRQVVLILVGLVGSGKSTFAQALEQHLPTFKRCNQDELGRRQQVEWLTRDSLGRGFSVCIDRTNFDPQQRATWIDIAREYSAEAWVIHFDTPPEICAARILTRTDHPTIHTPEKGLEVLARFRASFVPPSPHEGYARLLVLAPADHPDPTWSRAELAALLARVPVAQPATNLHRFFPSGERGSYAPARGRGHMAPGAPVRGWARRGGHSWRDRGPYQAYGAQPGRGYGGGPAGIPPDSKWRGQGSRTDPVVFEP